MPCVSALPARAWLARGSCCLALFLVSACALTEVGQASVAVQGMVIENQGGAWVSAVRVLTPQTGRFMSCGNIAPGSMCSTRFPEAAYAGGPVEITWIPG